MKIISQMGYLYRLSDRNYRKLLVAIAHEQPYDLDQLGKPYGSIDKNITDLQPGDAQMELDWMKSEKVED